VHLEAIKESIRTRDWKDRHRSVSPLAKADDAVVIDSTSLTIAATADAIAEYIEK
jgi:cytidylate kinase